MVCEAAKARLSALDRYRWAQTVVKQPSPNITRARVMLATALRAARLQNDVGLVRRIAAFALDLAWELDEHSQIPAREFDRCSDEEMYLCRELLNIDRSQAARRLQRLRRRFDSRLRSWDRRTSTGTLERRGILADLLHAQLLFNDRRPQESAERIANIIENIRDRRSVGPDEDWNDLEMEALYARSCAEALSGTFGPAVRSSAEAADLARCSASPLAQKVLSTYGTMLLSEDPLAGESLLRDCMVRWPEADTSDSYLVQVHLAMALTLQAYKEPPDFGSRAKLLNEAARRMSTIHRRARQFGVHPDAGAAALVRGVVSVLQRDGEAATWFAHGVACAARGQQMEVLWRSHINLAIALRSSRPKVTPTIHDHAAASLDIVSDTLATYSEPDTSPRFELLRIGMANAVSILIEAGDAAGTRALERFPRLRKHFSDVSTGQLLAEVPVPRHYQWLHADGWDYVLY
jgi:hypothetical protein